MIKEVSVLTLTDYVASGEEPPAFLFRGVSRPEYELTPSVGRNWQEGYMPFSGYEQKTFQEFKRRAPPWMQIQPRNDWEWMMLAQHHGMPTRLLDWTTNALAALFFCCCDDWNSDGVVYVLTGLGEINQEVNSNPFGIDEDFYVRPRHISPRIAAQSAFFTVSRDPRKPVIEHCDRMIRIRADRKQPMLQVIARYGINHASLFPGLDGLARDIQFEMIHLKAAFSMPS